LFQLLYSFIPIVRPYCNFQLCAGQGEGERERERGMIWRIHVLTSYFYLLYCSPPSASPFTFTLVVHSMCITGLLTLFASSTHSALSVCVSLSLFEFDLGLGFHPHEISPEKMGKKRKLLYRVTNMEGRCPESLLLVSHAVSKTSLVELELVRCFYKCLVTLDGFWE
jgi:hypothetical protein